jgi:hypothetical protein
MRQVVGQDAGVDHRAAQALQPTAQHAPVAVVDLPRPQRLSGLDQLVAGGQHGHPRPSPHGHFGQAQGRHQAQFDRPQPRTRGQHLLAGAHLLALGTHIGAHRQGLAKADPPVRLDHGIFLHFDAIGPRRQRRAGENSRAGARLQGLRGLPGENPLADRQRFAAPIRLAQGIAVHGAVRPGWQVEAGLQVLGQHSAHGIGQGDGLPRVDGCLVGHRQQPPQGVFQRDQRLRRGQLSHG